MAKERGEARAFTALGLMSGTSMDGIDAAILRGDGEATAEVLLHYHETYDDAMRALLRRAIEEAQGITSRDERTPAMREAEEAITETHAAFIERILAQTDFDIDLIGFHGQTVLHAPERGLTVQLGDGQALADRLGITVVWDMRANDVAHGGQGAPLAPAWHMALARRLPAAMHPVMFVNIGGVANITWIGEQADDLPHAFDTGPGNALMDDLVQRHFGQPHDEDGTLAARGTADEDALHQLLAHPALQMPPPRSFDRQTFATAVEDALAHLSPVDALATLARFTAHTIAHAVEWLPRPPALWIVAGGGRHNRTLMTLLAEQTEVAVVPAEAVEMNGDFMEAECWAWLAMRALRGLPLSWPTTTGAPRPLGGGVISRPAGAAGSGDKTS